MHVFAGPQTDAANRLSIYVDAKVYSWQTRD
jgi:hypothetical protein